MKVRFLKSAQEGYFMKVSWAINPQKVQDAIRKIIEISSPRKLILFGSYIRGDMHLNSDLDVLVVTGDEIKNTRKESIKIRRALKGIRMSMDIVVVPEGRLKELVDTPGLIYREAFKNGKVVYEST